MRCPILITGNVQGVIAQGDFIRQIQQALQAAGYHPGALDGMYGPQTAAALRAFQASRGDTLGDQAWGQVLGGGVGVAACATYRALGLSCDEVYCDISIVSAWLGDRGRAAALCTAVALAADQGLISLRCPSGGGVPGFPPITLPGGRSIPAWAWITAGAVVLVGGLVGWAIVRGRRSAP